MANKKWFLRNELTIICKNLVMTHDNRIKNIKLLKYEKEMLREGMNGITITDMPTAPRSGISDTVSNVAQKIEEIDVWIEDEQRRVDAVEKAIENLGKCEDDPEIRKQIKKGILDNIRYGGSSLPYEYVAFPEKYTRTDFYDQRKAFLREIGHNLHLFPKI